MTHRIRKAFFLAAILLAISIGALITMPATQAAPPAKPLAAPGDCTVTTTADSGPGSLRACILGLQPGATITFALTTFPPLTAGVILPLTPLPNITTDTVTIDGSSAGVILDGSSLSSGHGLVMDGASGVTIKGLQILNFPDDGVRLQNGATNNLIGGANATPGGACTGDCNLISGNGTLPGDIGVKITDSGTASNTIKGNYIGTDVNGTNAFPNDSGLAFWLGASNNTVGGSTPGERNLISGNNSYGIAIQNSGTNGNTVSGNYIGVDVSGTAVLSNNGPGIFMGFSVQNNRIGGSNATPGGNCTGACNLISGNTAEGLALADSGTTGNTVSGNYIGLDVSGTVGLGNDTGVSMRSGSSNNIIGSSTPGERNLISGNNGSGVSIYNSGTINNTVSGNYIGVDATGTFTINNSFSGIDIFNGASNNTIGGSNATPGGNCTGACNLISGNGADGVALRDTGTMSNTISGNYIGVDVSGTLGLGNGLFDDGVGIRFGPAYNVIGGTTPGERNVIGGNGDNGVKFDAATHNVAIGNFIGTNATGTAAVGNVEDGVAFQNGASQNRVGGNSSGERNLISGNGAAGVRISDSGTISNTVSGNYVGTGANGTAALGNGGVGIWIANGASNNTIGGSNATPGGNCTGDCNLVSGNLDRGIEIDGSGTNNNIVTGNYIGANAGGAGAIPNLNNGLKIEHGASHNIIGGSTPNERNLISGNADAGIEIDNSGTMSNTVQGNYIGTTANGSSALPNQLEGVWVAGGAQYNRIGGGSTGEGNLISGNSTAGVVLQGFGVQSDSPLLDDISLSFNGGPNQLTNGDFSGSLLHWGTNDDDPASSRSFNTTDFHSAPASYQFNRNGAVGGINTYYDTLARTVAITDAQSYNSSIWLTTTPGTNVTLTFWYKGSLSEALLVAHDSVTYDEFSDITDLPYAAAWTQVVLTGTVLPGFDRIGVLFYVKSGPQTAHNIVQDNRIGTDANGTAALGNGGSGVHIENSAQDNTIGGSNATPGGTCSGECNLISGNQDGIWLEGTGTSSNTVAGNYVGTDVSGTAPLGNSEGLLLISGASGNTIGGATPAERNLVSANQYGIGVVLSATQNTIQGNYIGTDAGGAGNLGNKSYGLLFHTGAHNNLAKNNRIAYTQYNNDARPGSGVLILHANTFNNTLSQNAIFSNADAGILLLQGGNGGINRPVLTAVSPTSVQGTAKANSIIEIFSDNADEGRYFHGSTTAGADGKFSFSGPFTGSNVTATATDANGNTSEFSVRLSGSGAFAENGQPSLGNLSSQAVALGDLDGDGDQDAFVANASPNEVWLNDGEGNFSNDGQDDLGDASSQAVDLGDLDGDGDLDAVVGNASGENSEVWKNNGSGTFNQVSGSPASSGDTQAVVLGDLDNDGDLDAFAGNGSNQANEIWLNDGQGQLAVTVVQGVVLSDTQAVALEDLDNDGDLDAYVANGSGQPDQVWFNNGSGTFTVVQSNLGSLNSQGVALGDIDGDGDPDAFVVSGDSGQPSVVWLNNGSGQFTISQTVSISGSNAIALGDLDGDGDLDAVVGNEAGQANQVLINDGSGSFTITPIPTNSGADSQAVALADLDNDGDLDIFIGNSDGGNDPGNQVLLNLNSRPDTTGSDGGMLNFTQGLTLTLDVPAGALSGVTTFVYTPTQTAQNVPANLQFAGRAFSLVGQSVFSKPVTATVYFNPAALQSNQPRLHYWDTGSSNWQDVTCTCDAACPDTYRYGSSWLKVAFCHLTDFGLFETAGGEVYLPLVVK